MMMIMVTGGIAGITMTAIIEGMTIIVAGAQISRFSSARDMDRDMAIMTLIIMPLRLSTGTIGARHQTSITAGRIPICLAPCLAVRLAALPVRRSGTAAGAPPPSLAAP